MCFKIRTNIASLKEEDKGGEGGEEASERPSVVEMRNKEKMVMVVLLLVGTKDFKTLVFSKLQQNHPKCADTHKEFSYYSNGLVDLAFNIIFVPTGLYDEESQISYYHICFQK
ncbi:hypothetical protein VNO78_12099 [Psophocarpus tetragonolobus]|uniref:Uncharacterized protein n=1 Tax=Psophocarpus tetragonolobus TaxID=3891 RepID=A0AAN9XPJ2_PSOTE